MNIERKRERKKESDWVGHGSSKELWKFQVNETNSCGTIFLVKYIYVCIRFSMYEILLLQLKLFSTVCAFCHENKTFKQI